MTIAAGPGAEAPAAPVPLRRLRLLHTETALALVAAAVLAALAAGPIGAAVQIGLLVAAVVVGLPHGALDHRIARARFAPGYGRSWPVPFLAGYVTLAGATLLAWHGAPAVALLAFLGLSVVHFGACDAGERGGWPLILAHGGLPIVLPALSHPGDVERLFAWLAGREGAMSAMQVLTGPVALLWAVSVVLSIALFIARCLRAEEISREDALSWALTGALAALFFVLPPLVAFALYFAFLHAPRALLDTAERDPAPLPAIGRSLIEALPLTFGALVLGGTVRVMQPAADWAPATVATVFWVLSALTVPHMWLAHPLHRSRTMQA